MSEQVTQTIDGFINKLRETSVDNDLLTASELRVDQLPDYIATVESKIERSSQELFYGDLSQLPELADYIESSRNVIFSIVEQLFDDELSKEEDKEKTLNLFTARIIAGMLAKHQPFSEVFPYESKERMLSAQQKLSNRINRINRYKEGGKKTVIKIKNHLGDFSQNQELIQKLNKLKIAKKTFEFFETLGSGLSETMKSLNQGDLRSIKTLSELYTLADTPQEGETLAELLILQVRAVLLESAAQINNAGLNTNSANKLASLDVPNEHVVKAYFYKRFSVQGRPPFCLVNKKVNNPLSYGKLRNIVMHISKIINSQTDEGKQKKITAIKDLFAIIFDIDNIPQSSLLAQFQKRYENTRNV